MTKNRAVPALVVLLVLWTASASWAFLVESGHTPYWWDYDTSVLKLQWNPTWNPSYELPGGPAPNEEYISPNWSPQTYPFESDGNIANGDEDNVWQWDTNSDAAFESDGIRLTAGSGEADFSLFIGNEEREATKYWYFEFATDVMPHESDYTVWDPTVSGDQNRLLVTFLYTDPYGDYQLWPAYDSGWVKKNNGNNDYLVWWANLELPGYQPPEEKVEFRWNLDHTGTYIDQDFHIARVTTGTYCTPEPASLSLLGLAALGMIGGLRRRRRR